MISSLACGGRVLGEPRYVEAAGKAADFILTRMNAGGRLLRTCRNGKAHTPGYLDDYAFFVEALLELYFATFDPRWLLEALRLNDETLAHFWDDKDGAFFLSADDAEQLVVRAKDIQDGATPAGNSVALTNLVRLAEILDSDDLRERAVRSMQALAGSVRQAPLAFNRLLLAVDLYYSPRTQVVIVGPLSDLETWGLIQTANQGYDPYRTVLLADATARGAEALRERVPLLQGKMPVRGQATAYVCRDRTCGKPASSPEELRDALSIKV
jgi:uncharacterized protein YyaL (SSP411 family)